MNISAMLPEKWRFCLQEALETPSFEKLRSFLEQEYALHTVFPPEKDLFSAFHLTEPDQVKVLILGQDPYHDEGQAHGLAFSVPCGVKIPPSLRNIYKELHTDLGLEMPGSGTLIPWARQGVLLLNTVLTVRAHQAGSHRKQGWEEFTDEVIRRISERNSHCVFVLWGSPAQSKLPLIDVSRHTVIACAHPSPLSAHRGFLGSRPFSRINEALRSHGQAPVDWALEKTTLRQAELF
ncbi:MAG: uracil-DNA glycosylase [Lentisphaeria bacterium]|nr:uracil-DNA glycosylase [Lentisphaeria bacterium]